MDVQITGKVKVDAIDWGKRSQESKLKVTFELNEAPPEEWKTVFRKHQEHVPSIPDISFEGNKAICQFEERHKYEVCVDIRRLFQDVNRRYVDELEKKKVFEADKKKYEDEQASEIEKELAKSS